jgi:acetyl-CoA acetyltransferase
VAPAVTLAAIFSHSPNLWATTGINAGSRPGTVELNEAFTVQSFACLDAWKIAPEIVNTKGGAIAIGHPLGASGGRILGTLAQCSAASGSRGVAAIWRHG